MARPKKDTNIINTDNVVTSLVDERTTEEEENAVVTTPSVDEVESTNTVETVIEASTDSEAVVAASTDSEAVVADENTDTPIADEGAKEAVEEDVIPPAVDAKEDTEKLASSLLISKRVTIKPCTYNSVTAKAGAVEFMYKNNSNNT